MKKYIITLFLVLGLIGLSYADTIDTYFRYGVTSEVNHNNLNGNLDNIRTVVNGGLNNVNTATNFRLFEILSSLPLAGEEGRIVFRTTDDTLNVDNGSAWVFSPTYLGDAVQNDILYFDGTTWDRLAIGSDGNFLQASGATVDLGWNPINLAGDSNQITGVLPVRSGGTGLTSGDFSRTAGGDLTGTYPNPTIVPTTATFLVANSGAQDNIDNTDVVVFDTEIDDAGSNFASNTFTAPVTGLYQLSYLIKLSNVDAGHDRIGFNIVTSNRTYSYYIDASKILSADTTHVFALSILADMDVNDTAQVQCELNGGVAQDDISAAADAYFSGHLVR